MSIPNVTSVDSVSYFSEVFNFFDVTPTLKFNFKNTVMFDMTQKFNFDGHMYISESYRHTNLNSIHNYISQWVPVSAKTAVTAGGSSANSLSIALKLLGVKGQDVSLQAFGSMIAANILMRARINYIEQGIYQFLYVDDQYIYSYNYGSLSNFPHASLTIGDQDLLRTFIVSSDVDQTVRNILWDSLNERKMTYRQHQLTFFDRFLTVVSIAPIVPTIKYYLNFTDSFYSHYTLTSNDPAINSNSNQPWYVVFMEKYIKGNDVQYKVKFGQRVRPL